MPVSYRPIFASVEYSWKLNTGILDEMGNLTSLWDKVLFQDGGVGYPKILRASVGVMLSYSIH